MLSLADPIRGGSLEELRQFLNIADDESFELIKGFLISTLRPNLPFAFLVLTGEQGVAIAECDGPVDPSTVTEAMIEEFLQERIRQLKVASDRAGRTKGPTPEQGPGEYEKALALTQLSSTR
jgi:hypothetical protein